MSVPDGFNEHMIFLGTTLKRWLAAALILAAGCGRGPEQEALQAANTSLRENRLQEAMATVETCLKQHPDSTELKRLRVLILLRAEQLDTALLALRSLPEGDPVLAQALHHADPQVRSGAARLIAERSIPVDCSLLVRKLDDGSPAVRRYCAHALGQKRGCDAVKSLFRLLQDDNWFVRAEAAKSLGQIGDPQAAGWLVALLNDGDGFVCYSAGVALRQLASSANRDVLLTAYGRATGLRQQINLAFALAKLREPTVLGTLVSATKSQDADQRRRAAEALGDYASAEVTNALVRLGRDSNPAVQEQAAISLRKVLKNLEIREPSG